MITLFPVCSCSVCRESEIAPAVKAGKKVLIAAHGNSLRALVKHLDGVSEEDIVGLNIPTGKEWGEAVIAVTAGCLCSLTIALRVTPAVPLVYELDEDLKPIRHYYLGDQAAIAAKISAVANQAAKK